MKKLLFFCLVICSIMGCDPTYYYEYVVFNDTPHNVKIEGFDLSHKLDGTVADSLLEPVEIIEVKPQSSFSVMIIRGFQGEPGNIFSYYDIGSVNIIFNNEKRIVQYCEMNYLRDCDIERNILAFDTEYEKVKTGRSQGNNEYRFTYTITEEDYNNAVPIEE